MTASDQTVAVVHFDGASVVLRENTELVVGRSSSADIRVGRTPTDSRVSRQHLVLSLSVGLVTVTRRSETQLVIVRSAGGEYALEAPGEGITRGGSFEILLPKTPDLNETQPAYYRLTVSAPGPGDADPVASPGGTTSETAALPRLSPRERQLLSAYARPLLVTDRDLRPAAATHREAAAELNYSYNWVREQIDVLRARLAGEGWAVGADKDSLCRWAVAARLVTAADLVEFDLE